MYALDALVLERIEEAWVEKPCAKTPSNASLSCIAAAKPAHWKASQARRPPFASRREISFGTSRDAVLGMVPGLGATEPFGLGVVESGAADP
jgi:hypothetical protein